MRSIRHTEVLLQGEHWFVRTLKMMDSGEEEESCHTLPLDTMEWRAAEYGIDPSDVETLLDIVLVEPYLTPGEWSEGFRLGDAPTIEVARQDHIARIAKAKLRLRISTRKIDPEARAARSEAAPGDPLPTNFLDRLRYESPMDPEIILIKESNVREHRSRKQEPALSRRERFRRELGTRGEE